MRSTHGRHNSQGDVAGALGTAQSSVEEARPDQAGDGRLVGRKPGHLGVPLDLVERWPPRRGCCASRSWRYAPPHHFLHDQWGTPLDSSSRVAEARHRRPEQLAAMEAGFNMLTCVRYRLGPPSKMRSTISGARSVASSRAQARCRPV
jgi:hypothetical protein